MSLMFALALFGLSDPTPEALALGRQVAESGTLAALLPLVIAKDTEDLIGDYPELSDAEKAAFRATAAQVARDGTDRLMTAMGRAYAEKLSIEDMKAVIAFNRSPAAVHWKAATPAAVLGAMQGMGGLDFKKDARLAYCKQSGKACEER
jgi:hypothetical protein